jgi:hypothetical protein
MERQGKKDGDQNDRSYRSKKCGDRQCEALYES